MNSKPMTTRRADEEIMTLAEAAKYLHTSYSTIYRLVSSGELKAFRLGHSWRTSKLACEEFVRSRFVEQAVSCRSAYGE